MHILSARQEFRDGWGEYSRGVLSKKELDSADVKSYSFPIVTLWYSSRLKIRY